MAIEYGDELVLANIGDITDFNEGNAILIRLR